MGVRKTNKEYSTLQIELPEPYRQAVLEFSKTVDDRDIVELTNNPHVTIKYGIETNDVEEVASVLGEFIPIRVMFGATKMFMASDTMPYDVLMIDAFGQSLKRLRKRIEEGLTTHDRWKFYYPHVTIGYLKQYAALGYVGNNPIVGKKVVVDEVVFAPMKGRKSIITRTGEIVNYTYERVSSVGNG